MKYEIADCIDAGTEFCPCHLAEAGECIICSQLHGQAFCDCLNWKGVCIYKEYFDNGNKPKSQRKSFLCQILKKDVIEENLVIISILVPHKLAKDLLHPGSYVFLRDPSTTQFYDTPISVMDVDVEENIIKLAIEIRGIKTKIINSLNENSKLMIRGPFWNGVFGLKNIYSAREGLSVIVAKGIGMAPMIPVIKKLYGNGNKVTIFMDKSPYDSIFVEDYLKQYNCQVIPCTLLEKGELSEDFISTLKNFLNENKVNLIHCDGADIIVLKLIKLLGDEYKMSSSNNTKMCCGEGVCGACTTRYSGRRVKRLCKYQSEPQNVFEGRRFI
ncbi:sulfide/dihydroorotate dehydrogenase-like FAD/NAD-binding protein [Clostridium sp.]|uniref:sulfide/dihydroorotate dehydrogenase-like FAD/NAD-binding protein n=1 Tax=Clostridium sp. TaxID=1506 RepID=UPI003463DFD1